MTERYLSNHIYPFCRGYGYGVVIPGGYLPIAISTMEHKVELEAVVLVPPYE
jgi:hypothetical protein